MLRTVISVLLVLNFMNTTSKPSHPTIAETIKSFVSELNDAQKKKALFILEDSERYHWNFVPTERKGIAFKELTTRQQQLFMKVLQTALSDEGYRKASSIMQLENILKEVEGRSGGDDYRDPGKYYFSLFGEPTAAKPWGWRIEGHHLALNFLHKQNTVACTPSFFGSNPAIVLSGVEKGKQVLKPESEKGFALLNSLTAQQLRMAIIAEAAFPEILTGNDRTVTPTKPEGIAFTALTAGQQKLFRDLLSVYIMNYNTETSSVIIQEIETLGFEKFYFAWAGARAWGKGHYYRIHGPTLWIEYDNTQNNANHVHTSIRHLTNDFGEDLLKKHYLEHKH